MSISVAHLSTVHPSSDVRIFVKECPGLVRAGYNVKLIIDDKDGGVRNGIEIVPLKKVNNRAMRFLIAPIKAFKAALASGASVIHFHDPELMPVGTLLRLFGKRVIYDVHEDLPRQVYHKYWIPKLLRYPLGRILEVFENTNVRFYSGIVAATPTIANRFPKHKTVLIQNFPIEEEFVQPENPVPYQQRENRVVYLGGISVVRGAINMVEAIGLVRDEFNTQLHLAGKMMPAELGQKLAEMPGWNKVKYHNWLGRKETANLSGSARAGLVTLHPSPSYVDSQPIKMYEYMAAGLPVIASDFPLWRSIIKGADCGVLVNPENPREIAEAIEYILKNPEIAEKMGKNGRDAVREKYNWRTEEKNLTAFYGRLTNRPSPQEAKMEPV